MKPISRNFLKKSDQQEVGERKKCNKTMHKESKKEKGVNNKKKKRKIKKNKE